MKWPLSSPAPCCPWVRYRTAFLHFESLPRLVLWSEDSDALECLPDAIPLLLGYWKPAVRRNQTSSLWLRNASRLVSTTISGCWLLISSFEVSDSAAQLLHHAWCDLSDGSFERMQLQNPSCCRTLSLHQSIYHNDMGCNWHFNYPWDVLSVYVGLYRITKRHWSYHLFQMCY